MSEVKKGNGLVYKNHPLRRVDNLIYYGSMADKYIVLLQILDTKKEQDMDGYGVSVWRGCAGREAGIADLWCRSPDRRAGTRIRG